MDFFHHQDLARQQTRWLLLYFILAMLGIVVVLNGVFFLIFYLFNQATSFITWWYHPAVQWFSGALILLMISASVWRMYQLAQGATYLADLLGALEIPPNTLQPAERRLLNVVEEMSIASGIPVPTLYVLDNENGINAFVAGLKPTDSILVVTRGLLNKLSRDELQGVIAHEFSHILNGDMRLNLKLVGGLAGILVIGQLGVFLFTNGSYHYQPGRQNELRGAEHIKKIEISPLMLPLGIILILVGSAGLFFGRLIKAAISRQRELLADASAVQFTRDRTALLNALLKIRNDRVASYLFNLHSEEVSHMCFGQVGKKMTGLSATHPPIDERIIHLDITYKYRLKWHDKAAKKAEQSPDPATVAPFPEAAALQGGGYYQPPATTTTTAQTMSAQIGKPTPAHLAYAADLYQRLPPTLLAQAHDPEQAQYIIYALLWQGNEKERALREQLLRTHTSAEITAAVAALRKPIQGLGVAGRLPLLDLAMPALKQLRYQQRQPFLKLVGALIKADKRVSLFEFVLVTILRQHLAPSVHSQQPLADLTPVLPDLAVLLSVLAHVGNGTAAYQAGWTQLAHPPLPRPVVKECSAHRLQQALHRLQALRPLLKKQALEAFAACVLQDQRVEPQEFEVLRAIAEALDCPMPPLLPS